jgi:hypothetical protein
VVTGPHVRKIHKVGHSFVVAVPPEMLEALGGQCGDYFEWNYSKPGDYVLTLKINRDRLVVKEVPPGVEVYPSGASESMEAPGGVL